MASSSSFTNDEIKHRIVNVYPQFVSDVDSDRLSDYLVQGYVITIDQWQRIRLESPAKPDRCRALLSHLFCTQHPRAFLVVLQALKKENHYILEFIDSQEPGCGFGVQHEKQPVLQAKIQESENDFMLYRSSNVRLLKKEDMEQRVHQLESELLVDKNKIKQLQKDNEDEKRIWEAEKDRLLKMQTELETKLHLDCRKQIQNLEEKRKQEQDEKEQIAIIRTEEKQRLFETLQYKSDPVLFRRVRTKAAEKERKAIVGLTILDKEFFIVNGESSEIEVYDSDEFSFNSRWTLKELIYPWDIGSCNRNKCLYIFDFKGFGQSKEILRVDPNGKLIKKWSTENNYGRLSVTNEPSIILTVFNKSVLNEYSPDGQLIREINLSSDAGICNPWHAVKLTNGHFVVSHGYGDDELHRVCVVDAAGKLKKSFGGSLGSTIGQMNVPVYLSVDRNGFVMVADLENGRVLLLDSDLEFKTNLLYKGERYGLRFPCKILLDESNGRIFVVDNTWDSKEKIFGDGQISIFNLK